MDTEIRPSRTYVRAGDGAKGTKIPDCDYYLLKRDRGGSQKRTATREGYDRQKKGSRTIGPLVVNQSARVLSQRGTSNRKISENSPAGSWRADSQVPGGEGDKTKIINLRRGDGRVQTDQIRSHPNLTKPNRAARARRNEESLHG